MALSDFIKVSVSVALSDFIEVSVSVALSDFEIIWSEGDNVDGISKSLNVKESSVMDKFFFSNDWSNFALSTESSESSLDSLLFVLLLFCSFSEDDKSEIVKDVSIDKFGLNLFGLDIFGIDVSIYKFGLTLFGLDIFGIDDFSSLNKSVNRTGMLDFSDSSSLKISEKTGDGISAIVYI